MRPIRTLVTTAVIVASTFVVIAPAHADDVTCMELPGALAAASDGDVIEITEPLCNYDGLVIPTGVELSLIGAPTTIDGGDTGTSRILTGLDNGETVIEDITFQNSSVNAEGGALALWGDVSPTLRRLTFLDNHTTDGGGGAVYIAPGGLGPAVDRSLLIEDSVFGTLEQPNTAVSEGGGLFISSPDGVLSVEVVRTTFSHNAAASGGGMYLLLGDPASDAQVVDSTFYNNQASADGGGAAIRTQSYGNETPPPIVVRRSLFDSNSTYGVGAGLDSRTFLRLDTPPGPPAGSGAPATLTVEDSTFRRHQGAVSGGGAHVALSHSRAVAEFVDNTFDDNVAYCGFCAVPVVVGGGLTIHGGALADDGPGAPFGIRAPVNMERNFFFLNRAGPGPGQDPVRPATGGVARTWTASS